MQSRSKLATLPLYGLRAFEAAARLGSFKAAAAELLVTPAAVSHHVKALEDALGVRLFDRLHRALRLTQVGDELSGSVREAFENMESALARLGLQGRLASSVALNVSAAPSVATKWLAPRLHRFHDRHPQIDLRLNGDDRRVDLLREPGTDVAVRYGAGPYEAGLAAIPLWRKGRVIMVCAPALLADGALSKPGDVLKFSLLRTAQPSLPQSAPKAMIGGLNWPEWLKAAGIESEVPLGPLFGSTQLSVEAAVAGKGLALAPEILVQDDIAAGRLASPFDIFLPDPFRYWLLYREDRGEETRIRAFRRWILSEAGAAELSETRRAARPAQTA